MACEVEWIPLGDIVNLSSGGTPDKKQPAYWDGEIPWISAKTLTGDTVTTSNLFITEEGLHAGSKLAPVGSILLLTRGSGLFKRIPLAIVNAPVAYNQDVKCMTSKVTTITNEYVFFALKALSPELTNMLETTGIGAGKLATDRLLDMPIPVLSHDEREKAVSFFSALSRKIMINNRINDYLFELVSSVFAHRFSDNVNTTELKNVLSISTKALKPQEHADEIWEHYSIPAFDEKHRPIFEPASGIKSNKYQIDSECILISKLNPSTKRIWMPCCSSNNAVCSTEFIVYRPYLKEYKSFYYAAIDSPRFTDYLLEHVSGSTGSRQRAQPKDTLNYLMPNPDNEEIKDFCTFADPIYRHIQINEQQTAKLELLRETLLPKLMSGAIDVSKVDLTQLTNNHLSGCGSFCSVCCPSGLASEFHEWFREHFFFGYGHLCKADLG